MNPKAMAAVLFALVANPLLTGCASTTSLVLSEPVGPGPRSKAPLRPRGSPVVYSAWDIYPGTDSDHRYREDFVLRRPGEVRVQKVRNHVGTFDEGPVSVSLLPGVYQVEVRVSGHGRVSASLVIEAGRTTSLWLDGTMPKDAAAAAADQFRLPDGQIIGWKAAC